MIIKSKSIQVRCLLIFLTIIFGCQADLDVPETPLVEQRRVVSAQDIPGVVQTLQAELGLPGHVSEFSTAGGLSQNKLSINWDQILQLIDTTGQQTYTFGVEDHDSDPFTFYNLVLQFNSNDQVHHPFLLKYEMAEEFIPEYLVSGTLENFTGSVTKILLGKASNTNTQNSAALSPEITLGGIGCPRPINYRSGTGTVGGGGGGSSGADPSIEEPEPVSTVTCTTYLNYTVWRNADGSLNNVQFGSIETECTEGSGGSNSSDNNENCAPASGEIPIIDPEVDGPDCESFVFVNDLTEAHWQQAVVRGIYFHVVLLDPATGVRGYTRIQFDQPIAFGVPTLFHNGETLTPGDAAWAAAGNLNEAMRKSSREFDGTTASPATVRSYFKSLLQQYFREAGGRVNFNYSGTQPATQYRARTGGIGNCRDH